MRSLRFGISATPDGHIKDKYHVFAVVDTIISCFALSPVYIAYWRGTWSLSDFYIIPHNFEISLIVSTIFGTLVQLLFTLGQEYMQANIRPQKHRLLYYVISRLYTYIYSIACVNLWRGGWQALDFYSGTDFVQVIVPTVISFIVLACMKCVRNLTSTPFVIALDQPRDYFKVQTMFKLTGSSDTSLYVLDSFFSVFVIGSLVVVVWRGVWCLTDIFLYPENDKYSSFCSLAIGYALAVVVFGLQIPVENLTEKLTGFWKIVVVDVYVFISFIGTINLWRGIWNLLNIYFLPEDPVLSCWLTHLGSFAILVLMNCSNSVLVRGVYLDGEGDKCGVLPMSYLRLIFEDRLKKKAEKKKANSKITSLSNVCAEAADVEKGAKENSGNLKDPHQNSVSVEIKS